MEAVERVAGRHLQREHRRLQLRYKATPGCDAPSTLCLKGGRGSAAAAATEPATAEAAAGLPQKPAAVHACQGNAPDMRPSGFSFPRAAPREERASRAEASTADEQQAAPTAEVRQSILLKAASMVCEPCCPI